MALDVLESAKLKLARIAVHLDDINRLIHELVRTKHTYEIVKDSNGKETLHFLVDAPRDVQVIVGEIIYQFRSSLDHIAFQLVQSNSQKITLPRRWDERCQFPLLLDVPTQGSSRIPYPIPVPYEYFEDKLPGISKAAYKFVESLQPYHRGEGTHNILRIVATLANIDKHRHLYVLLPRAAVHYNVTYLNGRRGTSTRSGLRHGAEIPLLGETPGNPPMNVHRSFSPYITFDETIGVGPDTLETENLLGVCLQQFETVIIPTFERLLNNSREIV